MEILKQMRIKIMDISTELQLYKNLYKIAKEAIDIRGGSHIEANLDILELEYFGMYLDPEKQANMVKNEICELKRRFRND